MTKRFDTTSDAIEAQDAAGGYVIDHGDCVWWTTDPGTAVDLTLPLVDEDRHIAKAIVTGNTGAIIDDSSAPYADHSDGTWSVVDPQGGRWSPDDSAASEINAAPDPASAAVRLCVTAPARGEWSA